jgi:hypothetical protein
MQQALTSLDPPPEFVLVDAAMRQYFTTASPDDPRPSGVYEWLRGSGFTLAAVVDDRTYGRMEIYRRK